MYRSMVISIKVEYSYRVSKIVLMQNIEHKVSILLMRETHGLFVSDLKEFETCGIGHYSMMFVKKLGATLSV